MVKDAEINADADKKRRDLVEVKNQAESLVHQTERSLEELGDKVPADEKEKVETALKNLKDIMEGENKADIEAKTQALMDASMKLGEIAYRAAQESAAGDADNESAPETNANSSDSMDDVVDADFTEVDDEDQKSA